jgi:hypothetical protein
VPSSYELKKGELAYMHVINSPFFVYFGFTCCALRT